MPVIWEQADGSLTIYTFSEDFLFCHRRPMEETKTESILRLAKEHVEAKIPGLAGLPRTIMTNSDIPHDRSKRYAWRLRDGRVVIDATVPEPPSPRKELQAELEAATTVADMKALG